LWIVLQGVARFEGFIGTGQEAVSMSQATKVVLGTVLLSAALAAGIIGSYILA
jgi:hypothetical protein